MAFSVFADGSLLYSSVDLGEDKIINPKLKVELNKAGNFTFSMLPTHSMYTSLHPMKTVITVVQDDVQLFRGRVIECKSDFFKQLNVTCEGDLAFLLDSVVAPFKYVDSNKKTIRQIFKKIVDEHNSQVENWKKFSYSDDYITVTIDDTSSVSATDEFDHTSYSDSSSTLTQELLDAYGGILRTRTMGNATYLDYIKDPSQTNTNYPLNDQEIQFSVNLLDIDQSYPVSDIFTILLPLGGDKVTIESVNNGSKYLENQEAINKFGRIVKVEQWSDERDKNKLLKKAQEYLKVHSQIFQNDLTIKAIDLHYLDPTNTQLQLGDRVRCVSEPHDIDTTLVCLSIDYDLQNPENNTYKIGSYIKSDKHKGKISKSSSKGRSGSRRKGSSSTSLSEIMAGTTTEAEETKEDEKTGFWTNAKNYARLMVGQIQEDVDEALTPIKPKSGSFWSLDNLIDEAKNLIFPEYQVLDKSGEPIYDDQGNPIMETVNDLMHMDNDVYNIKADIVRIDADIVEINARKISIGDDNTETIDMNADFINITGLVKSLLVHELTADRVDSVTISTTGTINTAGLNVSGSGSTARVPTLTRSVQSSDTGHAVNVQTLLNILDGKSDLQNFRDSRYVTASNLATGYVESGSVKRLKGSFSSLQIYDADQRKNLDVATQDWVIAQINGGILKGYFNTLFVNESGIEQQVASREWVNDQNFAKQSEIPSLSNYATQTWVEGKKYTAIKAANGTAHTSLTMDYIQASELMANPSYYVLATRR